MIDEIILVGGIGIITLLWIFYFKKFWDSYNQQIKLQEYMQSDEYKNKMKVYNDALKKEKKQVPKNMYR